MGLRMWVAMAIAYAGRSLVLWWKTFCVRWQSHGIGLAGREWADLKGLSLVFKLCVVACRPGTCCMPGNGMEHLVVVGEMLLIRDVSTLDRDRC